MKLQLLLATVNDNFLRRNYTPPFDNYLVINQVDRAPPCAVHQVQVFDYQEKGVSKSRNRALQKATAEICLLADDDLVFLESAQRMVLAAFQQNPTADIITFQAQTLSGAPWKHYAIKQQRHTRRSIMRVASWEIAFRRRSIQSAGLQFDERFGLGAAFPTGEENIFLLDALRKNLTILHVPVAIVMHPECSSGGDFFNHQLVAAKGAMLYRMFGARAYFIALWFARRKYGQSAMGYRRFYRTMRRGMSEYKNHAWLRTPTLTPTP